MTADLDPIRLNLDRRGMPLDYATYVWVLYGKIVEDGSPARLAFLHGPSRSDDWLPLDPGPIGTQTVYR